MAATETFLRILSQTLELNDVTDISVTSISADAERGDYYRDLVFFGTPASGVETTPTNLVLRIRSEDATMLRVTVPESEM